MSKDLGYYVLRCPPGYIQAVKYDLLLPRRQLKITSELENALAFTSAKEAEEWLDKVRFCNSPTDRILCGRSYLLQKYFVNEVFYDIHVDGRIIDGKVSMDWLNIPYSRVATGYRTREEVMAAVKRLQEVSEPSTKMKVIIKTKANKLASRIIWET